MNWTNATPRWLVAKLASLDLRDKQLFQLWPGYLEGSFGLQTESVWQLESNRPGGKLEVLVIGAVLLLFQRLGDF
jgi:hypothetical protein